ncbi:hypothetical protein [Pseudobutyrivibrio sp. MD2005]|uniref:hypothetical protein n=1 Tax=Pseudobutyrivibrio sp. MD2005 TaxID=1410616 RepID=UPI00048780A4|nr:hypothetical protein [Pseudobutyrivibrio sp. MD2005]
MAIAPIGGLSSYGSISSVQPMNYAVENDSDFSDVYNTESTKKAGSVNGATPVQYPNATIKEDDSDSSMVVDPLERQKKTIQVSSDFNNIAVKFNSGNTGYSMNGVGASYSTAGSSFDVYA